MSTIQFTTTTTSTDNLHKIEANPDRKAYPYEADITINDSTDNTLFGTNRGLAEIIRRNITFARDEGGELYFYKGGVYIPGGNECIEFATDVILQHFRQDSKQRTACEVKRLINNDAPLLEERPVVPLINVKNGVIDLNSTKNSKEVEILIELNNLQNDKKVIEGLKKLKRHTSKLLTTIQLPVEYNPKAKCPEWEKFIKEVFPEDAYEVAWKIIALLMVPYTKLHKAIMLLGSGSNGKSTFINGVTAFLGERNTCNLDIYTLEDNPFARVHLKGKLACICGDMPNKKLESSSVFKSIVGEDSINGEYKFGKNFSFKPYARLLLASYELPRAKDTSEGFYRRFMVLPFMKTFKVDPKKGRELARNLASDDELSGLLNKALEYLPIVLDEGIKESASMRECLEEHRKLTDHLAVWLDRHTEEDPNGGTSPAILARAYNDHCRQTSASFMSIQTFGNAVKKYRPDIERIQKWVNGKPQWIYKGIRLKEYGLELI